MKKQFLRVACAISIISGSAHAQYPVLDMSSLQQLLENVSFSQEQLVELNALKNIMNQQNALIGAIESGRFDSALALLKSMNGQLGEFSLPFLNSDIIPEGVSLDFSSHEAGLNTIKDLFYLKASDTSSGTTLIDEKNEIIARRKKALNEAVSRSYSLSQEYKEKMPEILDQYNSALQELNNSTSIAETEAAHAKIQASQFMLNLWRTNLQASQANVESMQKIVSDERVYQHEME